MATIFISNVGKSDTLIDKINGRAFLCMLSMSPEDVIEFDHKKVIAKTNAI